MKDYKELILDLLFDESWELTLEQVKDMIEIPGDEKMGDYAFPCFK